MRKHRTWWMGLGIGIILGASMLQLILFAEAHSSGLTLAEDAKQYSRKELEERIAKAVEEARHSANPETAEPASPSASVSESPTPSAPASPSPSPSASPSAPPEAEKVFYISPGMDLKSVARGLERLGLIEDADDFTDEARTISKQIKPGTSSFKGKPTYDEIIAELIRTKDD